MLTLENVIMEFNLKLREGKLRERSNLPWQKIQKTCTIANICIKIFRFRKNIYISGTEILDFPKKVYFTIIRPDDGYVLDYQCGNICDSSNASLLFFKRKLCLWFFPSVRGWSALCFLSVTFWLISKGHFVAWSLLSQNWTNYFFPLEILQDCGHK